MSKSSREGVPRPQVAHLNANALFTYIYMQMSFSHGERGGPGTLRCCVGEHNVFERHSLRFVRSVKSSLAHNAGRQLLHRLREMRRAKLCVAISRTLIIGTIATVAFAKANSMTIRSRRMTYYFLIVDIIKIYYM